MKEATYAGMTRQSLYSPLLTSQCTDAITFTLKDVMTGAYEPDRENSLSSISQIAA